MDKPWWIARFFKRYLLDQTMSVYLKSEKIMIMNDFIEQNKNNFNYEDIKFSSKLKKWK